MASGRMIRALLVPVHPSAPALVGWIDAGFPEYRDAVGAMVEGLSTVLQYDSDALIFINDSSLINGMDVNLRVTSYVFEYSEAARNGRTRECHPGTEDVRGPVVMLGAALTDVPQHLVDHFAAREVT
ncbi:hypothetical protein [Pseudonocardia charpentierae]|uniref:Uncharacterized protein n=1 Tax=Pseudonocardia charpentierae TaxID=3075545 RepID=A0ABU2NJP4_9PSEU|nr:hypothetical protein [Pseudonocardia sp. DSM 45834]MDT0353971.1 hypothetical protein [Pseudonocardia sp. DSM 45834]